MFYRTSSGSSTRTALVTVFLVAALVAALTSPSFAGKKEDLERQKREASSAAEDAKKDLDASTKEFNQAAAALKEAQAKLDAAEATLGQTRGRLATAKALDEEMQARLDQSQADLEAAREQLESGEKKLAKSEAAVEEFAVQEYLQGDRGLRALSGLLRGEDPEVFGAQISLGGAVGDQQLATMQQLDATRVILKLNREKVQKLRDLVKVQREEAAANLVEKQRLEAEAEDQALQVGELVSARQGARSAAAQAQAEDERQYQEKERERKRLEAEIRKLAERDVASGGKGSGGDSGGTLSYPVNGPITSRYGMRVHPITGVYKLHDGTDFGVGCGTPIKAAASGTIIQQYYNGGYGNRVILNNGVKRGVSVVTTYNHLSRFALGVGAKVKRGQTIGYVGSTGYSTGCHLHFMVLANGSTVNPAGWL